MTHRGPPSWLRGISSGTLLISIMLVAAVPAAVLSHSLLERAAANSERQLDTVATLLIRTLRQGGLPALRQAISELEEAVMLGAPRSEIAVWRVRGDTRQLIAETSRGIGETLGNLDRGAQDILVDGPLGRMRARALDLPQITREWTMPVGDLDLHVALPATGSEELAAKRTVRAVGGGFIFALLVGLALHLNHRQRYSVGLQRINAALENFVAGTTTSRVPEDPLVPELMHLSSHLNRVLHRLEGLIEDLRNLSAIAAHEMRTPPSTRTGRP